MGDNGSFEYTVSLLLHPTGHNGGEYTQADFAYNETKPFRELYVDTNVPRRAIRWIEKPFQDDEHVRLLSLLFFFYVCV